MIIVNTPTIEGKKIKQVLGLVEGSTVRAKWFGKDIIAGLKQIVGGEIKGYTEMLVESRKEATDRMINEAKKLNADAIVNVRYATSNIMQNAAELLAYGTAVKLK